MNFVVFSVICVSQGSVATYVIYGGECLHSAIYLISCCISLREADVPASDLVSKFASKYRYSGRTQYQVQLASSMSASATLDRSANLDRSTTASLISSRKYTGGSKSLENGLYCNYYYYKKPCCAVIPMVLFPC